MVRALYMFVWAKVPNVVVCTQFVLCVGVFMKIKGVWER